MDGGLIIALVVGAIVIIGPKLLVKKKRTVAAQVVGVRYGGVAQPNTGRATMIALLVIFNVLGIALYIASSVLAGSGTDTAHGTIILLWFGYWTIAAGLSFIGARVPGEILLGMLCCVSVFGWTWLAIVHPISL